MKIKELEGKDLEFEIDNQEIMDFFKECKYVILLDEKGQSKVLVLDK